MNALPKRELDKAIPRIRVVPRRAMRPVSVDQALLKPVHLVHLGSKSNNHSTDQALLKVLHGKRIDDVVIEDIPGEQLPVTVIETRHLPAVVGQGETKKGQKKSPLGLIVRAVVTVCLLLLVGGIIGAFLTVVFLPKLSSRFLKSKWTRNRMFVKFLEVGEALGATIRRTRFMFTGTLFGMLFWIASFLNYFGYAAALGLHVPLPFYVIAIPFVSIMQSPFGDFLEASKALKRLNPALDQVSYFHIDRGQAY